MEKYLNKISLRQRLVMILLLITFIAVILRINFFLHIADRLIITGDANNYHILSKQLVHDHIYGYNIGRKSISPNAIVPPVFPLIFSSVCALIKNSGDQINAMRIIQVIMGSLSPLLAYLSVSIILKRRRVAILTALLVAIYPPYYESPYRVLTEVTSLFTMLLYFYLAALSFSKQKVYLYLLSGAAFALQILTRPAMLPLFIFPFIFGFFVTYKNDLNSLAKAFIFTLCGFVIVMLPWWIRNLLVMHRFILTSDGSANPLLAGTYPDMKGMVTDFKLHHVGRKNQQAYAIHRIVKGFTHHTLEYLRWYTIGKINFMFSKPWMIEELPSIHNYNMLIHLYIAITSIFGVIWGVIKNSIERFVSLYCLAFLGVYLMFIPTERYSYQIMFLLMVISSSFIFSTFDLLKKGLSMIRKSTMEDSRQGE